jgi:hypothetical protein
MPKTISASSAQKPIPRQRGQVLPGSVAGGAEPGDEQRRRGARLPQRLRVRARVVEPASAKTPTPITNSSATLSPRRTAHRASRSDSRRRSARGGGSRTRPGGPAISAGCSRRNRCPPPCTMCRRASGIRWARIRPLGGGTIGSSSPASMRVGCGSLCSQGRLVQPAIAYSWPRYPRSEGRSTNRASRAAVRRGHGAQRHRRSCRRCGGSSPAGSSGAVWPGSAGRAGSRVPRRARGRSRRAPAALPAGALDGQAARQAHDFVFTSDCGTLVVRERSHSPSAFACASSRRVEVAPVPSSPRMRKLTAPRFGNS